MSPGYDRPRHFDMMRRVSYDCMFCDNAYPAIPAAAEQVGADPVFSGTLPEGIDCQRCHGPGSAHIADPKQPGLIVRDRRMEVCLQCHLETTSFALPNSVVRYDRGPFAYRPDEPLGDFMLFFDHAPGTGREGKFEIVSAAYRLRQSRCFLEGGGGGAFTCTTCHDPHTAAKPGAAQCNRCHAGKRRAPGHPAGDDCASCHMPKRRTEDVVHAVVTDHKIAARPPAGLTRPMPEKHETGEHRYRGEVVLYYPPSLPPSPFRDLYLATVQVKQASNPDRGREQLAAALGKYKPFGPVFYFDLAQADFVAGRLDAAIAGFTTALARDSTFIPARRNLGAALLAAGRGAEAIEVLHAGRNATPCDPALLNELARAHAAAGRVSDARPAVDEALRCDPRDGGGPQHARRASCLPPATLPGPKRL